MIYYIYQAFLWIIANFFITENISILDTPNFILIIYYHSVKMLSLVNHWIIPISIILLIN